MDRSGALALLGLSESDATDPDLLRRAYRRRMREVHPDVNPGVHAAEMTVSVSRAYKLLLDPPGSSATSPRTSAARPPPAGSRRRGPPGRVRQPTALGVQVLDDSSMLVSADRESTFAALLEAAHSLGEIGYLDRSAWLVEVLVEFVEAPTSSVVMTLQGRAGGTEVFCTVEPLSGGDSPPIGPVTRIVAEALSAL